ncbi:MAG: hypothetical protein AAF581_22540 [Planctomycetota bacterium]
MTPTTLLAVRRLAIAIMLLSCSGLTAFGGPRNVGGMVSVAVDGDARSTAELADRYLAGDAAAKRALTARGAEVVGELRQQFRAAERSPLLVELAEAIAREAIAAAIADAGTLIYYGQFSHLEPLGDEGGFALLAILRDEDAQRALRVRAAMAVGDITTALTDDTRGQLRKQLQTLIDDFLTEEWCALEAGYLLARLGDRSFVDERIATYAKIAAQTPTLATVPEIVGAQTELAEVHYRIADYGNAVKHYRQKRVVLLDLRERVAVELRPGIDEEVALLDYNLACSLSLGSRFDEAFESLVVALQHESITLEMIQADGDLRGLRATTEFASWFAAQGTSAERPKGAESTPPQPDD